ncbi:hypothetical protein [Lentzea sp. NEAU-D7]|uniref:hypothetical protein n=1 Tax=Lentzea sp. NEAU-D7 TaxID=2994667 RepID=UPI00224B0C74|nr:hypothetical protein [Lentzea sp. NEAU-D7]MCX2948997.1 hypothetical protein [Lentzea sp. NEAU-D7]
MFAMLSQLAEILSKLGNLFMSAQRRSKDIHVANVLISSVTNLQRICVRGERLLMLVERATEGEPVDADEFTGLVTVQADRIESMRQSLETGAYFLATVDADILLELNPIVNRKGGLLARWTHRAEDSSLSTTTLFFLPGGTLERVLDQGSRSDRDGLLDTADGMRAARVAEVRDLSKPLKQHQVLAVRAEIAAAREDLARIKQLCRQLLDSTREAVGPEVMADLRRKILPDY